MLTRTDKLDILSTLLGLVCEVSVEDDAFTTFLSTLSDNQLEECTEWAALEHCHASDNDIERKPIPIYLEKYLNE